MARRARGADHVHYNDMRTQANPIVVSPYKIKIQKRVVMGRVMKRAQRKKIINERVGDRKIVQWEVICSTKMKYYVCAVSRDNALRAACRTLRIPEDKIRSIEVYNDPIRPIIRFGRANETQKTSQQQGAEAGQEGEDDSSDQAHRQEARDPD